MNEPVRKYMRYLEIEKNASPHTREAYATDLGQLASFLGRQFDMDPDVVDIQLVKRAHLRMWMGELAELQLSKTSISRKVAAARSFFKYCYRRSLIKENPTQLLITPKKEKRLPKVVQGKEIEFMMDIVDTGSPWGRQEKAILETFYGTGIRRSELVNLNIVDVDFPQRQVKIFGKGAKERIVPVGRKALEALAAHLETRAQLFSGKTDTDARKAFFLTKNGARIYPRAVQRIVESYLKRTSEVTQKSPHVLRHSFATHMLDRGADIRVIKEFLGHSSLAATQVYTHASMEHLKNVYQNAHPRAEKP